MAYRNVLSLALLCLFLALITIAPDKALAKGCMSGSCHQELTTFKYMHGPVAAEMAGAKACVICHQPAGARCTFSKAGRFSLKKKDMCFICHTQGTSTRHSEQEGAGSCLNCHDPHGSNTSASMLRSDYQGSAGK